MSALTKRLPKNSSRSSTHASIVPKIALTTTTISEQTIVSSNAERASGAEIVVPEPVEALALRLPDERRERQQDDARCA